MADPGRGVAEHRARVLAAVASLPPVATGLADAAGLVLAADAVAAVDLPRFDHAAMDGYAVRAVDVAGATSSAPAELPVAGVLAAGDPPGVLTATSAIRIMTGAPVPTDADTVVPFEWTDRGAERVRVLRETAAGRHIRRTGEDVAAGSVAVPAGTVLGARHLGLAAAVGLSEVSCRPRPRVAVISTGAELVPLAGQAASYPPGRSDLPAGAVPESNSVALVAAARAAGADATSHGPVTDDPAALAERLAAAVEVADLVVTTGGISAGDHDVVKAALRERSGFWFGPVAVKPGRPQGCGALDAADGRRVPVVCLPGTPVAAYFSFLLFARPAIRVLGGRDAAPVGRAALAADLTPSPDRTLVLPARYDDGGRVQVLRGHVGHAQGLLARAQALIVVPPSTATRAAGEPVDVVRLDPEV